MAQNLMMNFSARRWRTMDVLLFYKILVFVGIFGLEILAILQWRNIQNEATPELI